MTIDELKSKANLNVYPELSFYLGIGKTKAYELVNRPDFPSFRIGTKILVNRERLEEWIANQEKAFKREKEIV